jgi:glutathione S-transferase/autophagy-related protein 2
MNSLIVYGSPPSQPSRAVYWTCLLRDLPFELRMPQSLPGPDFARLNPKLQIPTIDDGGFVVYEMPAILAYLCEKHGWEDLYPSELEKRAIINQYLHFHHSSTRLATFKLMAPHVTIAFGGAPRDGVDVILRESIQIAMDSPDPLGEGRKTLETVVSIIESKYFRGGSPFLCGTENVTIADIACYEELAQLEWARLFEFKGFPKIERWLQEMANLPFHEPVHRYNFALGDIAAEANTMERFLEASRVGNEALRELGISVTSFD